MRKRLLLSICAICLAVTAMTPAQAALTDGLVAYFKLDETSGTFAADSSGNGNHGTLVGTQAQWVEGYFDGGVEFATDEAEAHVEFPTTGMSASAGTISLWGWLREPQAARTRYFFGHTGRPPYRDRIQIYMDGGTTNLDLGLGDSHGRRTDMRLLPTQTWVHVVLTWDNGTYVVYVDGENIATGSYAGLAAIDPVANISDDSNPAESEAFDGILDEARIYDRAITADEVTEIYRMLPPSLVLAKDPAPDDKATDVPTDVAPAWTASEFAATHDVYFGMTFDDVNDASRAAPMDVLVGQGQTATTYDPDGQLQYGQTYYWRIDEVNAAPDFTIFKGNVWSFTVEPYSYPIANVTAAASSGQVGMGAANAVNGSGLNADDQHSTEPEQMWLSASGGEQPTWIQFEFDQVYKLDQLLVWNSNQMLEVILGFGAKDVIVSYSADGETWTRLGDFEFAQAPGSATYTPDAAVDFGGAAARYVKLTVTSNWGGIVAQYGLSEVRFLYIPVAARAPQPADGATGVAIDGLLTWQAGREAASHQVFLSTDEQAVIDGTAPLQTVMDDSFDPGTLPFGTTHYWKVVEVNEAADPASWEGDIWSFTTAEYLVIDDMEGYTDDEGGRIYEYWIDGLTTGASGSQVGYDVAPFAERTIVHGGRQSLPLKYGNTEAPFLSEAEREFASAQNWTFNGADTLSLWIHGVLANDPAELYVTVTDSAGKSATVTNPTGVTTDAWTEWPIPLADFVGVNMTRVESLILGLDSRNTPTKGAGTIYVDDIGYGSPANSQ